MKKRLPKSIIWSIKVALFALFVAAIWKHLFYENDVSQLLWQLQSSFTAERWFLLPAVLGMMLLNWQVEAFKWRQLIAKIEAVGQWQAFRSICMGITLAMFTPNRVGEFGGRVLLLQKAPRTQAVAISLLASFSQLIASFSLGWLGFIAFNFHFSAFPLWVSLLILLLGILIIGGLLVAYFSIEKIEWLFQKVKFLRRFSHTIQPLRAFSVKELLAALWLSALRHGIFSIQYYMLFVFFGVEVEPLQGIILILSIFFMQTILPSIALVELGIRSSLALYFMNFVSQNSLAILAAALLLWIINLLLPALIGLLSLIRLNVNKTLFK